MQDNINQNTVNAFWSKARSNYNSVRKDLAKNSNVPKEILEYLANDDNNHVRNGVAFNANTPIEVLVKLAKDLSLYVRRGIVRNPNTPPYILNDLATDSDNNIKDLVARNPNTPSKTLWDFLELRANYLKCKTSPNTILEYYTEYRFTYKSTCKAIAQNPNATLPMLEILYEDNDTYHIKYAIASNPNCPMELLEKLICDPYSNVRIKAIDHPKITIPLIVKLLEYERSFRKVEDYYPLLIMSKIYYHPLLPHGFKSIINSLWPRYNFKIINNIPPDYRLLTN